MHVEIVVDYLVELGLETNHHNGRQTLKLGTKNHPCVGKRVQIPAYTDLWMRGARFGTIERVIVGSGNYLDPRDPRGATIFAVRMDHPQVKRLARVIADDCNYL